MQTVATTRSFNYDVASLVFELQAKLKSSDEKYKQKIAEVGKKTYQER
jgi:hypothetical protein